MQAVILAAGESSRFWPLNQRHKSQIKIFGKSLIYWTIKGLAGAGIKEVIVISSPHSSLEKELAQEAEINVKISYKIQEKPLGTGNAIFQARDLIREPFFVFWPYKVNAKEIAEKILEKYHSEKCQAILVASQTLNPWDFGILKMEGEKAIEIVEKPKPGQEPSKIKVIGSYFLEPDFFDYYQKLPRYHQGDFIDALNLYIKDKETKVIFLDKEPPELKYPWELLAILRIMFESEEFQPQISPSAKIGKNVVINGKVYIGDNVIIGENTVIFGPVFIGNGCQIGSNNVFRGPVNLENNVLTGAFCEIKNCLIQEGTHFHSGYFGDSIIGRNCRFGAGVIIANRRLDRKNIKAVVKGKKIDTNLTYFGAAIGDNSRFGIHCSLMPGVLIGSNCQIGPHSVIFENIEDNTTFYTEFKGIKSVK